MADNQSVLLNKLLEKLSWLTPTVFSLPVDCHEDEYAITWIPVDEICYITTRFKKADYKLLYLCSDGRKYYSRHEMSVIAGKLADNPRFMRTSKYHLVNLTMITRSRVAQARDLWFKGSADPLLRAVSSASLAEFKTRFELL